MIRLVATDLDNTLLDINSDIPEGTKEIIRKAQQKGVIFAVATGRAYRSAKSMAEEIGGSSMIICYNGSEIRDSSDGSFIFKEHLDDDLVRDIIGFCHDHGHYLQMYSENEIIVEKVRMDIHPDPDFRYIQYTEVGDFLEMDTYDTPKLLLGSTPDRVPVIQAELEEKFGHRAFFAQSADYIIEIMPKDVNKGRSLERLCEHLGIRKEETMALGDNTNDIDLLKAAGLKVSVANGVQQLKDIADYVCEKERSEGFCEAIERFV